jgi:hypothetical protein
VCPAGTSWENDFADLGGGHEQWNTRHVCQDGSGSFTLIVDSLGAWEGDRWITEDSWTFAEGTGPYEGMEGEGTGVTICEGTACNVEYTGELWRER